MKKMSANHYRIIRNGVKRRAEKREENSLFAKKGSKLWEKKSLLGK